MFKAGDKVVPNGFRAGKFRGKDSDEHFRGTNATMERWEKEKTVLTVSDADSYGDVKVGDGESNYYHPAELRLAMPAEIEAAAPKSEPAPDTAAPAQHIRQGAVVETTGYGIGFVFSDKDSDGEYMVGTPSDGDYHFISEDGIKRVLYYVGADGGISFGQSQSLEKPSKASELRIGDVIKITSLDSTCSARRIGQSATIENKDESDLPLSVRYVDGGCDWLRDEGWEFVSRP